MIPFEKIVERIKNIQEKKGGESFPFILPDGIQIYGLEEGRFVYKPWGFELWLAYGNNIPYALKIISIRQGAKTSLHYHQEKMEHLLLLVGKIRLHYKDVQTGKRGAEVLRPGCVMKIDPLFVHRIEALSDVFLLEASSHNLEDVIRLEDDYQRNEG